MNKIIFSFLWVLSLGVAYWFGVKTSDVSPEWEETGDHKGPNIQLTHSILPEEVLESDPTKEGIATDSPNLEVSESVELSENNSRNSVSKTLSPNEKLLSSNPLERLQAFTENLKNPDQDSLNLALEAYESLPGGDGRFSELKNSRICLGTRKPTGCTCLGEKTAALG